MRRIAVVMTLALATSAFGQAKPPLPVNTAQLQPINRILAAVRQTAARFGGPNASTEFDKKLAKQLGPKGLAGLDLDRPITAYNIMGQKAQQQSWVVLIPVTDKADALDLLKRAEIPSEPTEDNKELYKLSVESNQAPELLLRFQGNIAYLGVNVEPADLEPKTLPTAATLTLPNESALLTFTTRIDQITPAERKVIDGASEQVAGQINGLPIPPAARDRLLDIVKVSQRYGALQHDQGKTAVQRIDFDPKSAEFTMRFLMTPKPATPLAGDIAARKATDNRFTAVVGPETVAGFVTKFPLFLPELRDGTAELLQYAQDEGLERVPEQYAPAAKEALQGLARAAKAGRLDLAGALSGPDAEGLYRVSGAVSFDAAAKLDAELRKLYTDLPEGPKGRIKLDAFKADGVVVHTVQADVSRDEAQRKIWGDAPVLSVAFTKTSILAAFGTDSLATVKSLITESQTPRPSPVIDFKVNPKRTRDFANLMGDNPIGTLIPRAAKDELRSFVTLTVAGGDALAVKLLVDLGVVPPTGGEE